MDLTAHMQSQIDLADSSDPYRRNSLGPGSGSWWWVGGYTTEDVVDKIHIGLSGIFFFCFSSLASMYLLRSTIHSTYLSMYISICKFASLYFIRDGH